MEIIPCDGTTTCNVVTTVGVPAQNLNNARSVNFSGIYKNGGCVPVPVCPSGMVPQIMVSPVSVSGLYEGMNGTNGTSGDAIPLTSFTAYATGPADYSFDAQTGPDNCVNLATNPGRYCYSNLDVTSNPQVKEYLPDGRYWRVCLEIVTEKGKLAGSNWKMQSGSVMAITRCAPPEEPSGSNENVFEPY
jgi:hypothetical protein